jgi:hypothetical protein
MKTNITIILLIILTLYLCVYLFINFNNYKNSTNFKIADNVLLSDSTLICRDTDNKVDCQPILTQNKLIKFDNYKNNVYYNKNALICEDIDKVDTCICIKDNCNYYRNLFEPTQKTTLINGLMTFSPNSSIYYTGRSLPVFDTNSFALTFFLKIDKIDCDFVRTIIEWDNFKLSIMPYKTPCSTKLYLQLYSLYEDGIFSNSCIADMTYYEWNHFVIQGNNNTIEYYFNGEPGDTVQLYKNYSLGDVDKYFIIGNNCPGISVYNMCWFNNILTIDQINYLRLEFGIKNSI